MTTTQIIKLAVDVWHSGTKQFGGDADRMLEWAGEEVRSKLDNSDVYALGIGDDAYKDQCVSDIHAVVIGLIALLRRGIVDLSQLDRAIQASF